MGIIKLSDNKFRWTFGNNKIFMEFISRLGLTNLISKDNNGIEASSIKLLSELVPMNYELCEKLILQIGLQIMVLQDNKKGLLFFKLNDIIVIDNDNFLLINLDHALNMDANNNLVLTYPINIGPNEMGPNEMGPNEMGPNEIGPNEIGPNEIGPNEIGPNDKMFLSPEVQHALVDSEEKVLPFVTPITCGYYSLANLCIYCLQIETLDPIMSSKMYYFFERCLVNDPDDRFFFYI
jgi:hypothetical protein